MSCIKRQPHVLKPEKSVAIPRHLLFVDTETWQRSLFDGSVEQTLRLGWACYYRRGSDRHIDKTEWYYFEDCESFWLFVWAHTGPKQKLWIIARSLVFDFTVLKGWSHLQAAGYKLKFFHNKGSCTIISVRKKGSTLVFLDSMNWFVESLAKTSERIGIPKMAIDFDTCTKSELSDYCRNDVLIELENFKLFIQFLEEKRVARLCYTRGSTAMSAFLLRHYTTKIYIHNNAQAIRLERDAYKGGRVECFYLGQLNTEQYYVLDVNSLYPTVMRDNKYPIKYLKLRHKATKTSLGRELKTHSVCAKVLIETDEPVYGVRRDRLVFPVGRFWTSLCTPELKYALEHNHLRKVETMVTYVEENIFASYVDKFYALRLDFRSTGVAEYEELCKKMLNSLYGKFGQKGEDWSKIGDCPGELDREELVFNMGGRRVTKLRYLMGEIFIMTGCGECFDSFPAIAAHVTAYARLFLWSLMQKAGAGNYFYCDTDSLIVNKTGLDNLSVRSSAAGLGGLKIEESCNHLEIRGVKDYSTESKRVTKGIRKNATVLGDGVYQQELWPSFRGLLRSGDAESYKVHTVTKHLNRHYYKGEVMPDGKVVPFVYADG